MPRQTNFGLALVRARRTAFAHELEAMSAQERWDLVDRARHEARWPDRDWIASHCAEKMPDLTPSQYVALAQAVKRQPGTNVYAYVHSVHGNAGFAFIDPQRRILVWFSLDHERNLSCFYLDETLEAFLRLKGDLYWRLADTELS